MINFGELPNKWCYVALRELGELARGKSKHRPRNDPRLFGDVVPFIQTGEVARSGGKICSFSKMYSQFGVQQSRIFPKGTICITIAANIADTGILSFEACFPDSIVGLITDENLANPYFVQYFLQTVQGDIAQLAPATAQANINLSILEKIQIPLPPLNEQRRLVTKIESLKARTARLLDSLSTIPALLDEFRQSVLAAAFRGDLTADWRQLNPDVEPASVLLEKIRVERRRKWEEAELAKMTASGKAPKDNKWKEKYKEPLAVDDSELPKLPQGWEWATLPQLGELNRGKSKHRPRNDPSLFGGSYPFIQTGDISAADGIISKYSQTYNEQGLKQSKLWTKGTLCITIAANIAETAILGFDACFPDSIVGFVPQSSYCNVKFIEYFIRTAKNDLERFAPSTAQKNINLEVLSLVAVPCPPIEEQNEIVKKIERYFSVAKAIENMLEINSEQIQFLNQTILAQAFRGALVPQDPNDEPASVLLERIRAEREKNTGTTSKRSKKNTDTSPKQSEKNTGATPKLTNKSTPFKEAVQMELELE